MDIGFETWKDIIEIATQILGFFAIIFTVRSFWTAKKQNYFTVVNNCINKFQENFVQHEKFDENKKLKYLDFVNEQLFYMENDYLPLMISIEWIDGMLDYLPVHYYNEQIFTNPNSRFSDPIEKETLVLYPRIKHIFTTSKQYKGTDLTKAENHLERKELLEEILIKVYGKKIRYRLKIKVNKGINKLYPNIN